MDNGTEPNQLELGFCQKLTPSLKIHNTSQTRQMMEQFLDPQMVNVADYDCFSQVIFGSTDDYKRLKADPWYKEHLSHDHNNFADTKKSKMTIGWVTEFVRDGQVVNINRSS
jgi:hypothetical protein